MSQHSRYIEKIPVDEAAEYLAGIWAGEEEDEDGLSVHREKLELREDGTFQHSLVHVMPLTGGCGDSECSCGGTWKLHAVRHLGADADAQTDKEIEFVLDPRGPPENALLAQKLIVCGVNPRVNGFLGMTCRLRAEQIPGDSQFGPRHGRRAEAAPEEEELEVAPPELDDIPESDVKQLAEATQASEDACRAALLHCRGVVDDAAAMLMEAAASSENGPSAASAPVPACETFSEEAILKWARGLAEATGRSADECAAALRRFHREHGTIAAATDAAVAHLLTAGESAEAASSASQPAPRPRPSQSPDLEPEAVQAARLTEVTGQPFEACLAALRECGGRADAAVAKLLGLADAEVDAAAEPASTAGPALSARQPSASEAPASAAPPSAASSADSVAPTPAVASAHALEAAAPRVSLDLDPEDCEEAAVDAARAAKRPRLEQESADVEECD